MTTETLTALITCVLILAGYGVMFWAGWKSREEVAVRRHRRTRATFDHTSQVLAAHIHAYLTGDTTTADQTAAALRDAGIEIHHTDESEEA